MTSNLNEGKIVTMLENLNSKVDSLFRLLAGKWNNEAARRRERRW